MNRKKSGRRPNRKNKNFGLFSFYEDHPELAELLVLTTGILLLIVFIGLIMYWFMFSSKKETSRKEKKDSVQTTKEEEVHTGAADEIKPDIKEDFLTISPYNRPGIELKEVKGVVIHYVSNPGSSAKANRRYFENLAKTHEAKASAHFIVGLDGEILQLVPLDEIAYCSNDANTYTISIECCHPDKSGKFNQETYQSAVKLTAWLCCLYHLNSYDVIRHYDVTGKKCPRYFVDHEDAWQEFKEDVKEMY